VEVRNPFIHGDTLGYVPLPSKYYPHWVDLCYQVVYHRNVYRVLRTAVGQLRPGIAKEALTCNFNSASARLKYFVYARRMILEEIFSTKGQVDPDLPIFNEFIIKNRFDYSWDTDDEARKREHIFKDPFSDEMEPLMGTSPPFL
jgi:hypothetical protein